MSNFSRFVPFSKRLSSFSVSVGAVEVIREPAGRPSEPHTGWSNSALKNGSKVVGLTDGVKLYWKNGG